MMTLKTENSQLGITSSSVIRLQSALVLFLKAYSEFGLASGVYSCERGRIWVDVIGSVCMVQGASTITSMLCESAALSL